MREIKLLKELTTYTAVSGNENRLSEHIGALFSEYCDNVEVDSFFNTIGIKKGTGSTGRKIMITAHYDEIGFLVKSIDENGFVKITNMGGIDPKILLAQEVTIHGKVDIPGIIGAKPPHLLKPEEAKKAVKLEDLSVDTGMNSQRVREIVSIGDVITFKAPPFQLLGNKLSSKSVDNRCGVLTLLKIMEELSTFNHSQDIYFVATTQEEVGLRGAVISSYNINPDFAVVIDACHGDIPDAPKDDIYTLGKGPAVAVGPNLHRGSSRKMIDVARDENIPYQIDTEPGDTGTEAWATQVSRSGIPTVLVSIPVRYMHTTVETVHMNDIKNAGRLVARFVKSLSPGMEEILCC